MQLQEKNFEAKLILFKQYTEIVIIVHALSRRGRSLSEWVECVVRNGADINNSTVQFRVRILLL